jgi:hypothetical protein
MPAPQFTPPTTRYDPYKNYRFKVKWDGRYVAGVSKVSVLKRCWVSEFQAMPELDGMGNAIAIQTLKLENEGWERDTSVAEPTETSYTLPAS